VTVRQPQQLPLFTRRQAPVPPKAGQLRRGGQMVAPAIPEATDRGLRQASTQLPMFTQTGEITLPALRAAGVKGKVKQAAPKPPATKTAGARGLKKGAKVAEITVKETPSAVQKPSAKSVDVPKQTGDGKGVRVEDQAKGKAAEKGEALKGKTKKQEPAVPTVKKTLKKETPPPPKAVAAPAAALTETPAETWDAMDTGVEWTDLTPELQIRWTNSDRRQTTADTIAEDQRNPQTPEAMWEDMKPEGEVTFDKLPAEMRTQWRADVATGKATIERAEELADDIPVDRTAPRTTATPAEILADDIRTAESPATLDEFRSAIKNIVTYAFFTSEETNTKKMVETARAFIANTQFAEAQLPEIDQAYLDAVQLVPKLEARYRETTKYQKGRT
jgi:hypothetical protein